MKKFLTILLLMIALSANAQHLTFSGIPIDGNINAFSQKLAAKGYRVSKKNASLNFPNTRLFEGNYMGQKVELYVSYVKTSKIVYEVKVVYGDTQKSFCDNFIEKIKASIETKYNGRFEKENSQMIGGESAIVHYIYNPLDVYLGYITTSVCYHNFTYNSFIIYWDKKNGLTNNNEELDDI